MYDRPQRSRYTYNAVDLHTADITKIIRGPKGKRGRLVNVIASITTTTAGATTTPKVQVGVSGTLTQSLNWDLGAVVAPAGLSADAQTSSPFAGADAYTKANPILAADTDVYFTFKAASGSGAAGVADIFIDIDWDI